MISKLEKLFQSLQQRGLKSPATSLGGWHDQQKHKTDLGKTHLNPSKVKGQNLINNNGI